MSAKEEIDIVPFRENLLKYTRKAYQMIPTIMNPRILDIGCGSGVPTLELARISEGNIIAIDVNQDQLEILRKASARSGFSEQITIMNISMLFNI